MDRLWSFGTETASRLSQYSSPPPEDGRKFRRPPELVLNTASPDFWAEGWKYKVMYSGTLIADLFAAVERVQNSAAWAQIEPAVAEPPAKVCHCAREISESEQFPQPFGLSPAHGYLGLLLVVHSQLVRTLEPGHDFADAVDVHQIGAVRPPEKIRV